MPMTFRAVAALVMISGPDDTAEEVEAVRATIAKWNSNHAKEEGVVFVPQHYLTNAVPVLRADVDGQLIINEQITNDADVVLALFKHRLGTPTPRNPHSGTVEEAEARSETGRAHVFFWRGKNLPIEVNEDPTKRDEWDRLNEYRATFHANTSGSYHTYDSRDSLIEVVERTLWRDARILKEQQDAPQPTPTSSAPQFDLEVSLEENEVWHAPELPGYIDIIIDNTRKREQKSSLPKSDEEIERWAERARARLSLYDEKFAAAVAVPIQVKLSTSKILKDLEVEIVFSGVHGVDPTDDTFDEVWIPLRKGSNPLYFAGAPIKPFTPFFHTSWDTHGHNVILTIGVPDLRKQTKPYESEPAVVLMIPFNETGIQEVQYSWRATATNTEGEAEGEGRLPVAQSVREALVDWIVGESDD